MNTLFPIRSKRRSARPLFAGVRLYALLGLISIVALVLVGQSGAALQPREAQADMLSTIKNWYANIQNTPLPTPETAAMQTGAQDTNAATTASLFTSAGSGSACPDGEVNIGNSGRGANAVPNCQPCPPGTVKKTAGGQEACLPPGQTLTLSCEPDGYTFRTVNRAGPAGSRCCARRATHIAGSDVGFSGASASGLWYCGGPGTNLTDLDNTPTPTPTPTDTLNCINLQGVVVPCPTTTPNPTVTPSGVPGLTPTPTPTRLAGPSACPDGQVNVGNSGRGANAQPSCQTCPPGTVKMTAGGQEACRRPGETLTLSCEPDGYTFRTVNRWGPSGTRCCAGSASLIPGTTVGATINGAAPSVSGGGSGIWVCGGAGGGGGRVVTPTPTPTPTDTLNCINLQGVVVPCPTTTPTGGAPSPTQGPAVSLCPDGQVNVGNSGRGANAQPSCQTCPPGTVKMTAGGQEACRRPGETLTLSCEPDGYTFRTVNRWGPSGTRCCAGRASLVPGTNVGGTGAGASGIWVCGGNGGTYGAGTRPSATPTTGGVVTPTPTPTVSGGYLATCSGGGVVGSGDPVIGVNVQTNGSILAAVDLRSIDGATVWVNGKQVSGTTFTLQKGDVLLVRTPRGDYVATTDTLGARESASVLIPMPCISVSGKDASGRSAVRIAPDAAFTAGLRLGEFEVWYRVKTGSTQGSWQKFDWLSCASSVNSCLALTGTGVVEAKIKTVSSTAVGGSGNWSLTASKAYGQ